MIRSMWQQLRDRLGPAVATLMVTLVGVHVMFLVAVRSFHSQLALTFYEDWLALSWPAILHGRIWTLGTYALLHDLNDPMHVLFNGLALYFFGPMLERQVGSRAFVRFFAISVLTGAVLQLASEVLTGPSLTVGASAGMMGLLAAFAWSNPRAKVLLFFVIPIEGRYLVPIVLAVDVVTWLSGSKVAVFAHIGGVLGAWLSVRGLTNPRIARAWLRGTNKWLSKRVGKRPPLNVIPGGRRDPPNRSDIN